MRLNRAVGVVVMLLSVGMTIAARFSGARWGAAVLAGCEAGFSWIVVSLLFALTFRKFERGLALGLGFLGIWFLLDLAHVSMFRKRLDTAQIAEFVGAIRAKVIPLQPELVLGPILLGALASLILFQVLRRTGLGPSERWPVGAGLALGFASLMSDRLLDLRQAHDTIGLRLLPWRRLPPSALPENQNVKFDALPKVEGTVANAQLFAAYLKRAEHPTETRPSHPLDVLIVHVESLRGDVLDRGLMPNFDKLRARCMVPYKHYSTGNNTGSSMFGLLFGLSGYYYPVGRAQKPIPPPLLALKRAGYQLHAHLNGSLSTFDGLSEWYFNRVIDDRHYYEGSEDRVALDRKVVDGYVASLANRGDEPHFDYITIDSTHYDYVAPEAFRRFTPTGKFVGVPIRFALQDPVPIENSYKNAVLWVDSLIDELLRRIATTGRDKRMLIVITGDHGEAFAEHQAFGHGSALVDQETRTATALCGPQVLTTKYRFTSHADVMPTLFDLIGLKPPFEGWTNGKSLVGYESALDYVVLSYGEPGNPSHGFVSSAGKLLYVDEAPPYAKQLLGDGDTITSSTGTIDTTQLLTEALAAKSMK